MDLFMDLFGRNFFLVLFLSEKKSSNEKIIAEHAINHE